jgi:hypothetical protein
MLVSKTINQRHSLANTTNIPNTRHSRPVSEKSVLTHHDQSSGRSVGSKGNYYFNLSFPSVVFFNNTYFFLSFTGTFRCHLLYHTYNRDRLTNKWVGLDFRLPPRCWCNLLGNYTASCGNYLPTFRDILLAIVTSHGSLPRYAAKFPCHRLSFLLGVLTREDGTDTLSRKVGK